MFCGALSLIPGLNENWQRHLLLTLLLLVATLVDVHRDQALVGVLLAPYGYVRDFLLILQLGNYASKHLDLPRKILIGIVVVHQLKHFLEFEISVQFLAFKMKVECQFPKTHGAHCKWLLVSLLELAGPIHEALVGLAVPQTKDVSQLMTSCFDGSVLHLFGHPLVELPLRDPVPELVFVCKVWVVASVTLDADTPALLSHSKDEGPSVFGVQVGIGEHQQTLVLFQLDVVLEVFKDHPRVELLDLSVLSHARGHNSLFFKHV